MVVGCAPVFGADESPVGIVSGSGINLRPLLDEVLLETSFADGAGMKATGVAGHDGSYIFGRCEGTPIVLQAGRIHLYEGHAPAVVASTIDALYDFGVRTLVLTNAVGGLAEFLAPGNWVAADEVCAWRFNAHAFPERMKTDFIVPGCQATGRYIWMHGPCYETRAEITALQTMGGMTVGMSTALELERCRERGIRTGIVSCVTNNCTTQESLSHQQVVETATRASEELCRLLRSFLRGPLPGAQAV